MTIAASNSCELLKLIKQRGHLLKEVHSTTAEAYRLNHHQIRINHYKLTRLQPRAPMFFRGPNPQGPRDGLIRLGLCMFNLTSIYCRFKLITAILGGQVCIYFKHMMRLNI